ncbi:type II toxin-antitoxin system PemK/MazF family toxin [Candidatus Peregrinibacteria bacterium]|nr:MAG: type II toxin-antitoxin system PemK/MazF family toxin [Candidatus Peregrinibacteria bacterium]
MQIYKYDLVLVDLNPTIGSEQQGLRPCLVLQNNLPNQVSHTFLVAPLTSSIKPYLYRVTIQPSPENGLRAVSSAHLLQIRVVDHQRIRQKIGSLDYSYRFQVTKALEYAFDLHDLISPQDQL